MSFNGFICWLICGSVSGAQDAYCEELNKKALLRLAILNASTRGDSSHLRNVLPYLSNTSKPVFPLPIWRAGYRWASGRTFQWDTLHAGELLVIFCLEARLVACIAFQV